MDYIRFTEGRRLPFGILLKWVGNINIDFIFTKYRLQREMDLWKTQSFGLNVIFSTGHFQQIQLYTTTLLNTSLTLSLSLLQLLLEGGSLGSWLIYKRFQGVHVTRSPLPICYTLYLQQTIYSVREIFFSPFLVKTRAW